MKGFKLFVMLNSCKHCISGAILNFKQIIKKSSNTATTVAIQKLRDMSAYLIGKHFYYWQRALGLTLLNNQVDSQAALLRKTNP